MPRKKLTNDHLPIKRVSLAGNQPPATGEGIRLAIYQGQGWVGDKQAITKNIKILENAAQMASYEFQAQLLLLPELFLCGYNICPNDVSNIVLTEDELIPQIGEIAQSNNIAIVCPYAEIDADERCYDAIMLIDRNGTKLRNYRKTQLWGNDEKRNWWYPYVDEPEDAYAVNQVNGINVGMLNCYEAEFPELSRILALKGAQLVVIPTAADVATLEPNNCGKFDPKGEWTDWAYPDVSKTAIPGNAYQNKMFVAYANHALLEKRSSGELSAIYLGNSAIADPYGQLLVAADNVETLLIADCVPGNYTCTHPDGQSDYIKDRRPNLYHQLTSMKVTLPDGSIYDYPEDPNQGYDIGNQLM
ncbi:MAG: nitrilase [Symploca sp. SIO2E6]|nr:nitrilase [Symploca sp. SIO2E6]